MYAKLLTALSMGLLTAMVHVSGTAVAAGQPEVPSDLSGVQVVDDVFMLAAMESGDQILLDARKPSDYNAGSIPGSINCPVSKGEADLGAAVVTATVVDMENCKDLDKGNTGMKIAAFCNGDHCWRSPKAALALKQMGYSAVFWYRLGLNDWKAKGLPVE